MSRPRASPLEAAGGRLNHVVALVVEIEAEGLTGVGVAYALQSSGRAMHAVAVDDLTPLVLKENALDHRRLNTRAYWRLQTVGRRGLVQQAWSAFDVALWDLKGKAANLPIHKLLGGARESCDAYGSDSAWLWMSVEDIIDASQVYLDQGMQGIKVKIGADPAQDHDKLERIREALGDDVWLAVDANERYDYNTALAMGQFFEEEIGVGWFEEPVSCEDVAAHARLARKLDLPIAAGEMLFGLDEFERYAEAQAFAVVQPDITRLGGFTATLEVVAWAERMKLPVSPHLQPEIAVQLGCGLPGVVSVEYMPWLFPLFANPPQVVHGKLVPPAGAGFGLELHRENMAKYEVK